jgi:hypothetical protein
MTDFKAAQLKDRLKSVFESMIFAWIWLLLLVIHIIFFSNFEPSNIFLKIFDRFVMISCFLLYPFSMKYSLHSTVWPFFIQFLFWWIFGVFVFWLYKKLSKI